MIKFLKNLWITTLVAVILILIIAYFTIVPRMIEDYMPWILWPLLALFSMIFPFILGITCMATFIDWSVKEDEKDNNVIELKKGKEYTFKIEE